MSNTVGIVEQIKQNPSDFIGTAAVIYILYLVLIRIMRSNDKLVELLSRDKLQDDDTNKIT